MKRITVVLMVLFVALVLESGKAAGKLRDLIDGLYGGDGITLGNPFHRAHFIDAADSSIRLLNQQIAAEVAVFPFSSSGGGFTYAFDPASGTFVRSTGNLGPLFAERAPTLGRGKFNFNFAYTFYGFDRFEGEHLDNLRVEARHDPDIFPTGDDDTREGFELDTILLNLDVDLRVQLFSFAATYGITDRLDIGILVPIVHIDMRVKSTAQILIHPDNRFPDAHSFTGAPDSPIDSARGKATGLGDIVLRAKYRLLQSPLVDMAGAMLVKLETGDEDDFLGTGSTNIRPFLVFSRTFFDMLTPHINLGYEFNLDRSDQNSLEYVVGADIGNERFTVAVDLLGSYEPRGDGIGDHVLTGSLGIKWNPFRQFVLFLNAQLPLNDEGLRSELITTFGAEMTF